MISRLRLAVYGPYRAAPADEDLATLVWRVGGMREQIEDAHAWLDIKGAPRTAGGGTLTLRGRMDALDNPPQS